MEDVGAIALSALAQDLQANSVTRSDPSRSPRNTRSGSGKGHKTVIVVVESQNGRVAWRDLLRLWRRCCASANG